MRKISPIILMFSVALSGCKSVPDTRAANANTTQKATLTSAMQKTVNDGLVEMITKAYPEAKKQSIFEQRSFIRKTGGNIQVCGRVGYSKGEAPFYLELSPETGEAIRGQIGFDKLKAGKVRFMCR